MLILGINKISEEELPNLESDSGFDLIIGHLVAM